MTLRHRCKQCQQQSETYPISEPNNRVDIEYFNLRQGALGLFCRTEVVDTACEVGTFSEAISHVHVLIRLYVRAVFSVMLSVRNRHG